jgi:hypothetical protein
LTPKGYPPCRHTGNLLRTAKLQDVTCTDCRYGVLAAIERGDLRLDPVALRLAWGPRWRVPEVPLELKPLPKPPARRWKTVARMIEAHSIEGWPDDQVLIENGCINGGMGWDWGEFTLADLKRLATAALKSRSLASPRDPG